MINRKCKPGKKTRAARRLAGLLISGVLTGTLAVSTTAPAAAASWQSNADYIFDYLTQRLGYSEAAACGIMANIRCESTFNPHAWNAGGGSYGLCQWTGGRYSRLRSWCGSNGYDYTTIDGQLAYLEYELENYYPRVEEYIRSVDNTAEGAYNAGQYYCYHFEAPASRASVSVYRGSLASGTFWDSYRPAEWYQFEGVWHYILRDGSYQTEWLNIEDEFYYMDQEGRRISGWKTIDGDRYYFDKNGVMLTGWHKIDGRSYYFAKDGSLVTGLMRSGDDWYLLDDLGNIQAASSMESYAPVWIARAQEEEEDITALALEYDTDAEGSGAETSAEESPAAKASAADASAAKSSDTKASAVEASAVKTSGLEASAAKTGPLADATGADVSVSEGSVTASAKNTVQYVPQRTAPFADVTPVASTADSASAGDTDTDTKASKPALPLSRSDTLAAQPAGETGRTASGISIASASAKHEKTSGSSHTNFPDLLADADASAASATDPASGSDSSAGPASAAASATDQASVSAAAAGPTSASAADDSGSEVQYASAAEAMQAAAGIMYDDAEEESDEVSVPFVPTTETIPSETASSAFETASEAVAASETVSAEASSKERSKKNGLSESFSTEADSLKTEKAKDPSRDEKTEDSYRDNTAGNPADSENTEDSAENSRSGHTSEDSKEQVTAEDSIAEDTAENTKTEDTAEDGKAEDTADDGKSDGSAEDNNSGDSAENSSAMDTAGDSKSDDSAGDGKSGDSDKNSSAMDTAGDGKTGDSAETVKTDEPAGEEKTEDSADAESRDAASNDEAEKNTVRAPFADSANTDPETDNHSAEDNDKKLMSAEETQENKSAEDEDDRAEDADDEPENDPEAQTRVASDKPEISLSKAEKTLRNMNDPENDENVTDTILLTLDGEIPEIDKDDMDDLVEILREEKILKAVTGSGIDITPEVTAEFTQADDEKNIYEVTFRVSFGNASAETTGMIHVMDADK